MQVPTCLAMMICDVVIDDAMSHKKSLVGLFNNITSAHVPCVHRELNVFSVLTDGQGVYQLQVKLIDGESDKVVVSAPSGEVNFESPLQTIEVNFCLRNLPLPKFGTYRFDLYCGNTMIHSRKFFVQASA